MEIIGEIIVAAVQFLVELLLQIIGEGGFEAAKQVVWPSHAPGARISGLLYVLAGVAIGGLSLVAFPSHFARTATLRLVVLALAPLLSAVLMHFGLGVLRSPFLGAARRQRFWWAYAFGLAFALVRFFYAR